MLPLRPDHLLERAAGLVILILRLRGNGCNAWILIGEGKAPDAVLVEIRRREERLKVIESERAALVEAPPAWNVAEIRAMCGDRLRRFPELLHGNVPVARQALRKLFAEPLRISPVTVEGRKTWRFEGETMLGPLFDPAYKGLDTLQGNDIIMARGMLRALRLTVGRA